MKTVKAKMDILVTPQKVAVSFWEDSGTGTTYLSVSLSRGQAALSASISNRQDAHDQGFFNLAPFMDGLLDEAVEMGFDRWEPKPSIYFTESCGLSPGTDENNRVVVVGELASHIEAGGKRTVAFDGVVHMPTKASYPVSLSCSRPEPFGILQEQQTVPEQVGPGVTRMLRAGLRTLEQSLRKGWQTRYRAAHRTPCQ